MYVGNQIIRNGVGLCVCLGLLAACQDRGQFRAKTYNKAEIEAYCQKLQTQGKPPEAMCTKSAAAKDVIDPNAPQPVKTPADSGGVPPKPLAGSAPKPVVVGAKLLEDSGSAPQSKPVAVAAKEGAQKPPVGGPPEVSGAKPEEGPDKGNAKSTAYKETVLQRDQFFKENETFLGTGIEHLEKIIRGVTISVTPTEQGVVLIMDAYLLFGTSDVRYLSVPATLLPYTKEGDISELQAGFKDDKANEQPTTADHIKAWAACEDEKCAKVQVRLAFRGEGDSEPLNAVFDVDALANVIVATNAVKNLADLVSFQNALKEASKSENPEGSTATTPAQKEHPAVRGVPRSAAPAATSAPQAEVPAAAAPKAAASNMPPDDPSPAAGFGGYYGSTGGTAPSPAHTATAAPAAANSSPNDQQPADFADRWAAATGTPSPAAANPPPSDQAQPSLWTRMVNRLFK